MSIHNNESMNIVIVEQGGHYNYSVQLLHDIHNYIAGLIIGCILFAILLLAVVACIISTIYRVKERPKMKMPPKKTVFQK